jgi:hypothetical protein
MATYTKFDCFVEDLCNKLHDVFGTAGSTADTLMLLLTNTAPVAGDLVVDTTTTPCTVKATSNAVEVAAGNGYTKTGLAVTNVATRTTTTVTMIGTKVVWTCTPAAMPTFRYVVMYNITAGTTSTRPVIAWWDYGVGGVTLNPGETFSAKFSDSDTTGTIFTLT